MILKLRIDYRNTLGSQYLEQEPRRLWGGRRRHSVHACAHTCTAVLYFEGATSTKKRQISEHITLARP